jgi:uncharacterized protein (TIGR03437 family)
MILGAAWTASAQTSNTIPPAFFGISALGGTYPVPTVGTLGHPEFSWADLESSPGQFNFTLLDVYVNAAQQHGLMDPTTNTAEVVFTLSNGTPNWAVADQSSCNSTVCTVPPDNLKDWKDFVTALVQHYNGLAEPHIHYFELWNEANNAVYWSGSNAQMLAMAKAAYPIVHQDRYSQLLTPSVAGGTMAAWMTGYLQGSAAPFSDGCALHGYLAVIGTVPYPMPEQESGFGSIVTMATRMRSVLDSWGMTGKPMLVTEGSWGTATLNSATQTAWLARYILLLSGLRALQNIQTVGWFAWSGGSWGNLADVTGRPTAAGLAYTQLYNWLVGASIAKPCSSVADGTWTCSFTRPGGYVARAVWNTQGYINYTPGLSYTQYRDLTGKTTAIGPDALIDVGPQPVWIEGTAAGTGLAPVISLIANAEGEIPVIAPNMWVEIKGMNLARAGDTRIWKDSDFSGNQMPRQMDGVSVTVNGKAAYLYYISPTQVNVLTPPDAMSGNVPVQLSFNGIASPPIMVRAQAVAPSFFVFGGGPYAAAEHATGKYVGPATLYPGLSTPAKPGEIVVLYGNGFGAVDPPVQAGLPVQSGDLPVLPEIRIGGANATVLYGGLIGPGEYQFNVIVPAGLVAGDQPVMATYGGFSTQPGLLISVQP